jgi:hypothetical protein
MPRARKLLIVASALVAAGAVLLMLAGSWVQRSIFYPKPRVLPPVVSQTTEQLLARLQAVLETNAPMVARFLQPGLSDAQISALEGQGRFQLSEDLRALYRWRNGMPTNSSVGLLSGQRFLPLDEVVRERTLVGRQLESESLFQRATFAVFAGHRKGWVHVLDDGAGDGYFYDPERAGSGGAFFYHMAEGGYYLWFPSLRNFLSGTIEAYESQAIKAATDGKTLKEDNVQTQKIWDRLGKSSESG